MREAAAQSPIDQRIAATVRRLRRDRGWSLDALAQMVGGSRATLSRIENAEVSASAALLGDLAAAFGLTPSRLLHLTEETAPAHVPRAAQPVWRDPDGAMTRRMVSPPAPDLAGEVVEASLAPGARIAYAGAPAEPNGAGRQQHLVLLEGGLTVSTQGPPPLRTPDVAATLAPGDCLRFRGGGRTTFAADPARGARYLLFTT